MICMCVDSPPLLSFCLSPQTVGYRPYEVLMGNRSAPRAADIFAVGSLAAGILLNDLKRGELCLFPSYYCGSCCMVG